VKRYVAEAGSQDIRRAVAEAAYSATSLISRAEVSAALARAVRMGVLSTRAGRTCQEAFLLDWPSIIRVGINESIVAQAGGLAWQHGLRGYDAVQLASTLAWKEALGGVVTFATFDRQLWTAARAEGVIPFPERLG
jgi:predicted nucleic acid-binding protein